MKYIQIEGIIKLMLIGACFWFWWKVIASIVNFIY